MVNADNVLRIRERFASRTLAPGLALMAVLGASCGASDDEAQPGAKPLAIQGGEPEFGYEAVGRLLLPGGSCSSALVSPSWVLTARHCVNVYRSSKLTFSVLRKDGTKSAHEFDDIFSHPTRDLTLLHLQTPIHDVAPLRFAEKLPAVGEVCVGVGYGAHDDDAGMPVFGEKRSCTQTVEEIGDRELVVVRTSGIVDGGDSGSPLLCGGAISGVVRGSFDGGAKTQADAREAYTKLDLEWVARISGVDTAAAAAIRAEAAAKPAEPAVAWAIRTPTYKGLAFQKLEVRGTFPTAFHLGAPALPPEAVRAIDVGDSGFAVGYIVGAEPGRPASHVESISAASKSFITGTIQSSWCSPITDACYLETKVCQANGTRLTNCMQTSREGDPILKRDPFDFVRGMNEQYLLVYVPVDAARYSTPAAFLNGGEPVSRGVHLISVRELRDKEADVRVACWDRAEADALAAYNRQSGTHLSPEDAAGNEAFYNFLLAWGLKAGCNYNGLETKVIDDLGAVSLGLRMGAFEKGFVW